MSPLRRRMIDDMQIRNLTPNTQRVYVAQVVRFACHFRKSPELLGPAEIRTYLIHLTQERRLAASSIIVTVSALRFFFTVTLKRPWIVEDDIPAGRDRGVRHPIPGSVGDVAHHRRRLEASGCGDWLPRCPAQLGAVPHAPPAPAFSLTWWRDRARR
jgi:hypothetical protein